jgi:hypothetical protein
MPTPEFNKAFKNNFYLTSEWADFCSKVTNIKLTDKTISKQKVFLLKNKNISISNYGDKFSKEMKDNKISFMRVLPQVNNQTESPSFIEYAIFYKKSYEEAVKNYKRSFTDALKQGEKYPHTTKIIKKFDKKIIIKVYNVYTSQMKRLNSAIFPFSFFEHLIKSPSSLLFILEHKKNIISYSFCFQHKDNLYASIGGGNPDFFKLRASNKLYNELIKYSCENNLNIHLGIGEKDAGFNLFKEKAGAFNYKCERHPNDEWMIKMLMPFLKLRLVGKILQFISKKSPEKVVYTAMPFT